MAYQKDLKIIGEELSYRIRIMSCIILSELLILGLVALWPVSSEEQVYQDLVFSDSEIIMEEALITRQRSTPPPPPRPVVPVPVPNDRIIEEKVPDMEELDLDIHLDPLEMEGLGELGESEAVAANPQLPPNVLRIVEPTVPEAAKKADVRARIWVTFLINKEGEVEEATIAEIRLYGKDSEEFRTVDSIGYGLTEATIEAALRWRFRPAKDRGETVKAYARHIFTYGF